MLREHLFHVLADHCGFAYHAAVVDRHHALGIAAQAEEPWW
jgi:hypothetical protein